MKNTRWILLFVALFGGLQARATVKTMLIPANPIFTDTGLNVQAGDQIHIDASGVWSWGAGASSFWDDSLFCGPDGTNTSPTSPSGEGLFPPINLSPPVPPEHRFFLGKLMGFIGTNPSVAQPVYFPVGPSCDYIVPAGGKLWLGINDDYDYWNGGLGYYEDDNVGALTVTITTPGGGVIIEPTCQAPLIVWNSPSSSSTADCPPIVMEATALYATEVDFYDGNTQIGIGSKLSTGSVTYRLVWFNPSPGTHNLHAVAKGCGFEVATPTVGIVVRGIPDGLVSWWPAESDGRDIISGNNGTAKSWTSFTSGQVGYGFLFDGPDSGDHYVSIPASPSLDIGTGAGLTIEGWIQMNYINPNGGVPIIEWDSMTADGLQLWINSPNQRLYANLKDTSGVNHQILSDYPITTGEFTHVALTYDKTSGIACLYMNGTQVKSANFGSITPQTTYPVNLGARTFYGWGSRFNNGVIDELSLYNRALSGSEIGSIYSDGTAYGHPGKCPPQAAPKPRGFVDSWSADGYSTYAQAQLFKPAFDTSIPGKVGDGGFDFDGINKYMVVNESQSLNVTSQNGLTWEGWINPARVDKDMTIVEFEKTLGSSNPNDFGVQLSMVTGGGLSADVKDTGGNHHIFSTSAPVLTVGNWAHVALVYNRPIGVATIYVNGVQAAQSTLGTFSPQTSYKLVFGANTLGNADFPSKVFSGQMDEMAYFRRVLSQSEIADIYAADSGGKSGLAISSDTALVSWWKGTLTIGFPPYAQTIRTARDGVGQNHGEMKNAVSVIPGEVNNAFNMAGKGSFVWVDPADAGGNAPILDIGQSAEGFTMEGWINPVGVQDMFAIAEYERAFWTTAPADLGVQLWTYTYGGIWANIVDTTGLNHIFYTSNPVVKAGVWSHVALVYDKPSGVATMYVNGVQAAQSTLGTFTPQTSYKLVIGSRTLYESQSRGPNRPPGKIDELSIYNRPLTQNELAAIYAARGIGKQQ